MNFGIRLSFASLAAAGLLATATGCMDEETVSAALETAAEQVAASEGVNETLTGELSYLTPGEYIVNDQAFFVSEDTEITGGIYSCYTDGGPSTDENGNAVVSCTASELEETLASGTTVFAEVVIVDGVAQSITEYGSTAPESGEGSADGSGGGEVGVSGSLAGELSYLAPGEYIVNDQAFFVSDSTEITGGIYSCYTDGGPSTDENGNAAVSCPLSDFEETLESGTIVFAEVVIVDGVAQSITEYETY
ncbi:hypothetical protein [Nocardiopsis algeriensis]|uniref:Exosome complex RNA-binding protein Csl4 n=1 Tax=Nocardiopsis algeriensis TaxID=1478215 RepID=A0A841II72_9ACTN|nr:hypothetical protein [Nocardiopsis algeriensis]MBB6118457.1 exosome complex RNA-binding protein Csl4 [Nocardiopsis algeriensis]